MKRAKSFTSFVTGGTLWLTMVELDVTRGTCSIWGLPYLAVALDQMIVLQSKPTNTAPQLRHIFNSWKHLLCAAEHHLKQGRRCSDAAENKLSLSLWPCVKDVWDFVIDCNKSTSIKTHFEAISGHGTLCPRKGITNNKSRATWIRTLGVHTAFTNKNLIGVQSSGKRNRIGGNQEDLLQHANETIMFLMGL